MHQPLDPSFSIPPELDHVKAMYEQDASLTLLGSRITKIESGLAEGEFVVAQQHCLSLIHI